ncbi:MAG: aldehyde dehydrogenase [Pseudomonadota bacterium]
MTTVFHARSPNTGRVMATIPQVEDREIGLSLARLAKGTDALTQDLALRKSVLLRCLGALEAAREELVELTIEEVGKTRSEATGEIPYAASFLETSLRLLREFPFETMTETGRSVLSVARGTGLLIAPYNDPVAGLARKIGPCVAAGAAALVKPSELGVQCALALARQFSNAGLDDYVSVLPLAEPMRIQKLIAEDSIGTVSFTGSTRVGLQVAASAAASAKAHIGEWGGTNPFVVFADADLDQAVADLVSRKIRAAGQACSAQNIVYVETPIAGELSDRVDAALTAIRFGPATDADSSMGPVRTAQSVARLAQIGNQLEQSGATLLCGGIRPVKDDSPFLAPPTVYLVSDAQLLETEELFGPMMGIASFDNRSELKDRLARNRQPLVLYLYGADLDAMQDLASGLRYGSIGLNTTGIQSPDAPTGGFGLAGLGREGGAWGLAEFLTTINVKRDV